MPNRLAQRGAADGVGVRSDAGTSVPLDRGGTGSSSAVTCPGRGEYGKTCTFVIPAA